MQKWEYMTVTFFEEKVTKVNHSRVGKAGVPGSDEHLLSPFLNEKGAEGWEAVNIALYSGGGGYVLLKREVRS